MAREINHSIDYYTNKFVNLWAKANAFRVKAARVYAEACNKKTLDAKYAFRALEGFQDWTEEQWKRIYLIGSGVILSEYIDAPDPAITRVMAKYKVSFDDQLEIFTNGLEIATLAGNTTVIRLEKLQEHHIAQAFIEATGEHRSIEDQVQFMRERVRENLEVLENHSISVRHACHISPEQVYNLLTQETCVLDSAALMAAAQVRARLDAVHER